MAVVIKFITASVYFRRRSISSKLIYTQIIKYLLYNLIIFNKRNYPHFPSTPRTGKWIHFIDFSDKPCPGSIALFWILILQNNITIQSTFFFFFTPAPYNITIESVLC